MTEIVTAFAKMTPTQIALVIVAAFVYALVTWLKKKADDARSEREQAAEDRRCEKREEGRKERADALADRIALTMARHTNEVRDLQKRGHAEYASSQKQLALDLRSVLEDKDCQFAGKYKGHVVACHEFVKTKQSSAADDAVRDNQKRTQLDRIEKKIDDLRRPA